MKRILAQSADGLEALCQKLEDMKKELQELISIDNKLRLDLVAKDAEIEEELWRKGKSYQIPGRKGFWRYSRRN